MIFAVTYKHTSSSPYMEQPEFGKVRVIAFDEQDAANEAIDYVREFKFILGESNKVEIINIEIIDD